MRDAPIRRKGRTEASTSEPDSYSVSWALLQLTIRKLKTRFIAGFAISAIAILSLLVIQFAATIPNVAYDGCARVGFPVEFFRGCYGTLSLYWPAMTVTRAALVCDAIVWLAAAVLLSIYMGSRRA